MSFPKKNWSSWRVAVYPLYPLPCSSWVAWSLWNSPVECETSIFTVWLSRYANYVAMSESGIVSAPAMMTSNIKFLTLTVTADHQIYLTRCYYCVTDNLRSPSVVGLLLFLIYIKDLKACPLILCQVVCGWDEPYGVCNWSGYSVSYSLNEIIILKW